MSETQRSNRGTQRSDRGTQREPAAGGPHDIVVLGAGYTGMLAAIRLARRTRKQPVRITLVNPSERFTERLRMHQVAAGAELADHRIPDLLAGTGVTFRRAAATAIDPVAHRVNCDDGSELGYDTLVYALGSRADTTTVPGVAEHARTLDDPRAAHRMSQRLAELEASGGAVAVCGGGLTGVEAATEIAESHPGLTVTLISTGEPAAMLGERPRAYVARAMDRLNIVRRSGTRVTKVLPDAVRLDNGVMVPAGLTLWTAGVRVPALAAEAGITTDAAGAIVTDATLRSVSHPDIYAIGDAAAITQPWGRMHGTCQSGMPTAAYAADTIARRLRGKPVRPFRFGYFHQPVSLGRRDAVIGFTHADDSPRRGYLTGRAAVRYKEFVSSSPVPTFRLSRRANVSVTLSRGGRATRTAGRIAA
ncbi:NADH dehydrogenase FAD-containing subunit [Nocardia kruczakiae]|uniref:NADH dehydrogenase FAD-containing subunit n=1 Tax=Nocardia kruczakiae TaxID=261477 RepID=A0ABU1XME9_9NOCA|nr:FAD-dependent oxidoreductase [Nocardia kruczakiae]MDR7171719.1 NADH dehydrogenase FAD-containing subunit [Nocardia kruczakiae]